MRRLQDFTVKFRPCCCTAAVRRAAVMCWNIYPAISGSRCFIYNPNIYPESEYTKRIIEQQKLIKDMRFQYPVSFLAGKYDKEKFYEMAKGMEHLKEGGARCMKCYELRLEEAAQQAAEGRFDYFTTTLSISL